VGQSEGDAIQVRHRVSHTLLHISKWFGSVSFRKNTAVLHTEQYGPDMLQWEVS